jgi:4-amino-4-deoxy-L-arabinose transferase-like glycosyltransferase
MLRKSVIQAALVALLVRIFFVFVYPGTNYYYGISGEYISLADNVLAGRGFVVYADVNPTTSSTPNWTYVPSIDRPLGYFFLMFVPYWLFGTIAVQLFQAVLAIGSVFLLYEIAERMFSQSIAVWSAFVYALWPLSARFEVTILPDAVTSFFLLLGVWLIMRSLNGSRSVRDQILAGISLGCGTLMRPDVLFLPLFILPVVLVGRRWTYLLRFAGLVIAGMAIAIVPHAIRNFEATNGEFVPIGLGNGISLWEGISQFGDTLGTVHADEDVAKVEGYPSWAYPDAVNRDRKRFAEAVKIIKEHPVWYAGLMVRRIPLLLKPDGIVTSRFMLTPRRFFADHPSSSYWDLFLTSPFWFIVQLGLIAAQGIVLVLGSFAVVRLRKNCLMWFAVATILYYFCVHISTNTEPRYFYPVIPFLLLLAAAGWEQIRFTLLKKA